MIEVESVIQVTDKMLYAKCAISLLSNAVSQLRSYFESTPFLQIVTNSRADLAATFAPADCASRLHCWCKVDSSSFASLIDYLVNCRDTLNISLAPDAHKLGQVILLADPRLTKVSALFDHAITTGGFAGIAMLRLDRAEKARLDAVQKLAAACDNNMQLVAACFAQRARRRHRCERKPPRLYNYAPCSPIFARSDFRRSQGQNRTVSIR